jgi:glycosyltransferase involved in cell wall biosynthesis
MVVKNEQFYIEMALRSVIDFVDGVFVIDTGSIDNTLNILYSLKILYPKLYFEQKKFCESSDRFPPDYDEVISRNYAIERALNIFGDNSWIIILDGDEVLNPRYFECLSDAINVGAKTFGHSTNVPASPYLVWGEEKYYVTWSDKWKLFDPHVRAWNTNLNVRFVRRLQQGHMILKEVGKEEDLHHEYVTTDNVHFHLHRGFGPKCLYRFINRINFECTGREACKNLGIEYKDIFNQKLLMEKFPKYFDSDGKFIPPFDMDLSWKSSFKPMTHPLPDYVVEKWKRWGYWV